ncbi:MAG: acireductone synthase [Alphaproteobacteria bacterium]|nr:acireductone synthase [Alphaproteobacteria bacterium]
MKAALLDIEGTIGDIAFVRDVLFPFARTRLAEVLQNRWTDPEVEATVAGAREATGKALDSPKVAEDQFLAWMDEDKKITPLKALQGIIWREGYASGELKAHLYPDAVEAIRTWSRHGVQVFIYSSGSIAAQKLYVAHSVAGDLSPLVGGYFDTTTGPKGDPASYTKIATSIGVEPFEMTFFSDAPAETDAAHTAGVAVYRIDRKQPPSFEGNDRGTPVIGSFVSVLAGY